jgi:single-strand DNA-binding protein
MLNSISIAGRLGRDVEEKLLPGGTTLNKLAVAVDDYRNKEKVTDWFYVTIWGELPKFKLDAMRKGATVMLKGKMISRQYEKDGVKITAWEIETRAFDVSVVTSREDAPQGQQAKHRYPEQPQQAPAASESFIDTSENLPF